MIQSGGSFISNQENAALFDRVFQERASESRHEEESYPISVPATSNVIHIAQPSSGTIAQHTDHLEVEETLSLTESEKDLIKKALQKHKNKRKYAAQELGISERTLYRKIKEYNLTK